MWTKLTTIRPKVEFFLASAGKDKASFEIFQFVNGQVRKSSLPNLVAGDAIGPTGWSLVDAGGTGDNAQPVRMRPVHRTRRCRRGSSRIIADI